MANSISVLDVVAVGAGTVERNSVVSILILRMEKNWLPLEINTIQLAVNKKKIFQKKHIAVEVTIATAKNVGNYNGTSLPTWFYRIRLFK